MHFSTSSHHHHDDHHHTLAFEAADIIFVSAADTDLSVFDSAYLQLQKRYPDITFPSFSVISLSQLQDRHNIDHFVEEIIPKARLVFVRILGGYDYWSHGVDKLSQLASKNSEHQSLILAFASGDDNNRENISPQLLAKSTLKEPLLRKLDRFCQEGGRENYQGAISVLWEALRFSHPLPATDPTPVPPAGIYTPANTKPCKSTGRGVFLLFYRALILSGQTQAIDSLIATLQQQQCDVTAYYLTSLRHPSSSFLRDKIAEKKPYAIITSTSFIAGKESPLADFSHPIFQTINSNQTIAAWHDNPHGVDPQSFTMQVALPEIDGHILSHITSCKEANPEKPQIKHFVAHQDGINALARNVRHSIDNQQTSNSQRKTAIIMAHYPARDARMANGVGLDTPASVFAFIQTLANNDYFVDSASLPQNSNELIEYFQGSTPKAREWLDVTTYNELARLHLHPHLMAQTTERWGHPMDDPHFDAEKQAICLPLLKLGHVVVGLQPSRGYHLEPKDTYHDPALVPPHLYIAFYLWLRFVFHANVAVHFGKHGNLEWLPGKAVALSSTCWPRNLLGDLHHVYPFIVNDPGEGAQAKRRTRAVIVDHLTPPLERAESFGHYATLEVLLDEYYHANTMDSKRAHMLEDRIRSTAYTIGLDKECDLSGKPEQEHINAIDAYLCDLKEMQIRAGLHVFGTTPGGKVRHHLLMGIARANRGNQVKDMSILRAITQDLALAEDFDPLAPITATPWQGKRPDILANIIDTPWRHDGDTIERLEALALAIVEEFTAPETIGTLTTAVLQHLKNTVFNDFDLCGSRETANLLKAIAGKKIPSGPAGAPTRGRPEVLPTGKNFFSLDPRTMPTPTAWEIGKKSAEKLLERYLKTHGKYPKQLALSAWGTANMRTGGDDIAQMLALLGVQPLWDDDGSRIKGFEVISLEELKRPRVDITLRISGFFRDAFSHIISFLDEAVRAIADRTEESADDNPLASNARAEAQHLQKKNGMIKAEAFWLASSRIFGSKPGAYGAGLQTLIDADAWSDYTDLADAFLSWSSYIYAAKKATPATFKDPNVHYGFENKQALKNKLSKVELVLHNQDNHEHDILDSDDYYQFEGGLTASVRTLAGKHPEVYHIDNARPDHPQVRTLSETIGRVVRARLTNPKWINAMQRHGFKGGFEMAASVTYLVAFAATTDAVLNEHFDLVFEALLLDEENVGFLKANNPDALKEICQKLELAFEKGLWSSKHNLAVPTIQALLVNKEPL